MKSIAGAGFVIILIALLISCKKDTVSNALVGKWNVLSDSTFEGVAQNNHALDYTGEPGDYFDFRTDGKVYIKESSQLDTLSYTVISSSAVIIQSFGLIANGVPETSDITYPTNNSVTITAPVELTPGGEFGRKVMLSK